MQPTSLSIRSKSILAVSISMDDTAELDWQQLSSGCESEQNMPMPKRRCSQEPNIRAPTALTELSTLQQPVPILRQSVNLCGPVMKDDRGLESWRDLL
jgi:hypothetical protein